MMTECFLDHLDVAAEFFVFWLNKSFVSKQT